MRSFRSAPRDRSLLNFRTRDPWSSWVSRFSARRPGLQDLAHRSKPPSLLPSACGLRVLFGKCLGSFGASTVIVAPHSSRHAQHLPRRASVSTGSVHSRWPSSRDFSRFSGRLKVFGFSTFVVPLVDPSASPEASLRFLSLRFHLPGARLFGFRLRVCFPGPVPSGWPSDRSLSVPAFRPLPPAPSPRAASRL